MLIVETDRKGYEANEIKNKLGVRASDTSEIVFQDLYVPQENLIGIGGEGFHYLVTLLNWSRILAATGAVGLAQGAMEKALRYVKSRKQFGRALSEF